MRFVWATLGGPAGKRLAPLMTEAIEALQRHGELDLSEQVRDKLCQVSAATIDRMLAPERAYSILAWATWARTSWVCHRTPRIRSVVG